LGYVYMIVEVSTYAFIVEEELFGPVLYVKKFSVVIYTTWTIE